MADDVNAAVGVSEAAQGVLGRYVPRRGPSTFADEGACGQGLDGGLLRFHDAVSAPVYRQLVVDAFPRLFQLDAKADVLAFDWNGRQYLTAKPAGARWPGVLMADMGTGVLSLLGRVKDFASAVFGPGRHDMFDGKKLDWWLSSVNMPYGKVRFDDSVAYRVPLWCGGEDSPYNLCMVNTVAYWTEWTATMRQMGADEYPGQTPPIPAYDF